MADLPVDRVKPAPPFSSVAEFPKDVGPPDKSGENPSGPMNAVAPSDQKSGNYATPEFRHAAICNMMLRLKYIEGANQARN